MQASSRVTQNHEQENCALLYEVTPHTENNQTLNLADSKHMTVQVVPSIS